MARAAVIPPSPPQRATHGGSKTTKASGADTKKRGARTATATRTFPLSQDSDDSDDELGLIITTKDAKPSKRRGRPPTRPKTTKSSGQRGKKAVSTPAPAPEDSDSEDGDKQDEPPQIEEPRKKRVGRPRKNPLPAETSAPKPRGRPKAGTTKQSNSTATATTRKKTRAATEADAVASEGTEPKHIVVATNSTTMRSNILRGPAKKKTVTFQDASGSGSDDEAELAQPAATGRRRAATRSAGASKTGLAATPARKPAAAKKDVAQPLSPKKAKQMAKSLSAYDSSDSEDDELSTAKVDVKKQVKLVIHSPIKHGSETTTGLGSPVRKINFSPKKASSLVDENGEPKLPTLKHGPAPNGLSSPVRKINFTTNRSQHAVADDGHLALPLGKSVDFSDSVFMSSPAKRPPTSPFQFTLKDTPNRGALAFRNGSGSIPAPNFTPGRTSPLKMTPRKGHLGASFPQSAGKASTPLLSAKTSFIQSPAKRITSPFKRSMSQSRRPAPQLGPLDDDVFVDKTNDVQSGEANDDKDWEMVEEVARDIFGIEWQSDSKTSSASPPNNTLEVDAGLESDGAQHVEAVSTEMANAEPAAYQDELQIEMSMANDEVDTICFDTMEDQIPSESHLEEEDREDDMMEDTETPEESPQTAERLMYETDKEPDLYLADLGEAEPSTFVHESLELGEEQDQEDHDQPQSYARHLDEQQDASSEVSEADEDEMTLVVSEATGTLVAPISPYEVNEGEVGTSPLQRMQSTPPPVPTPPVCETASPSPHLDAAETESTDNLHEQPTFVSPGIDMRRHTSPTEETTQLEISSPGDYSQYGTPGALSQQQSLHSVDLEFTPLAKEFGRWQTDTPSKDQTARPRRRGVFSLVGPLEQAAKGSTKDSTNVAYPDLSERSVPNSPSLFSELPLQPQSDYARSMPVSAESIAIDQDQDMINSPSKGDGIFEDSEPAAVQTESIEQGQSQDPPTAGNAGEREHESHEDEDKENQVAPSIPPATPLRARGAPLQTFHTVSRVPLKAEGEVSPLKLPRKRGLSLSGTPPSRTSPRSRGAFFLPRNQSAPALSPPRKTPRIERSPTPKRRISTARRSIGRVSAIGLPKAPSAVNSPAKTPRQNKSASKQVLRGAVVHVDVHTTEGEDASGIFVELLQQMGARCVKSWSWNPRSSLSPMDGAEPKDFKVGITHAVYKDGGLRTLEKVKHAAGLVKCVGVGWVLDCERENQWLDESPYTVDCSIIPRGGAKRRKSMEPRALSNVNGTLVRVAEPATPSASGRRCGADWGAMEGFRKITPPTPRQGSPSTPTQETPTQDRYHVPATPGYDFANLDDIDMSPATPFFLSNRAKLVQQSCPPKQSRQGLFPGPRAGRNSHSPLKEEEDDDDDQFRRHRRLQLEAARRKSLAFKPSVASPLAQ